ncbi:MAG: ABC transporter ATP-binding protein [Planctomycetota bacterium JB042]
MARIELRDLAHRYPGAAEWALRPLDLTLADGEIHALLGPSGCGKTTLLNLVSGLLSPTRGAVRLGGSDVTAFGPRERGVAQVFQFPVVYETMTVRGNLEFPLRNRGVPAAERRRRAEDVAARLDLDAVLDRSTRGLPADVRQRIALGRGLVRDDVAAVLLDEPLTAVDPAARGALRDSLRAAHRRIASTLVYVTHDQGEALAIADRVVVMDHGRVVQQGTPRELLARPSDVFVARFLGSPGMNLLPGGIESGAVRLGGDGRRSVGVRPEDVRFAPADEAESVAAEVEEVVDEGHRRLVFVRIGDRRVVAAVPDPEPAPAPGACRVAFDAARAVEFVDGEAAS